jgi:hypothetical protein
MAPKFVTHVLPMRQTREVEGTGYVLYQAELDSRPARYTVYLSYAVSGKGGVGGHDVELPFLPWRHIGNSCPAENLVFGGEIVEGG